MQQSLAISCPMPQPKWSPGGQLPSLQWLQWRGCCASKKMREPPKRRRRVGRSQAMFQNAFRNDMCDRPPRRFAPPLLCKPCLCTTEGERYAKTQKETQEAQKRLSQEPFFCVFVFCFVPFVYLPRSVPQSRKPLQGGEYLRPKLCQKSKKWRSAMVK